MIRICFFALLMFVTVAAPAQLTADFSASPTSGCSPLVVSFTDLSTGGAATWFWDFGNGNTSTLRNPAAVYILPGTYTVTLTVTDGGALSDTEVKTFLITVFQNPTASFASIGPRAGCAPFTLNLQDLSTPGSAPITGWLWDFGDGTTGTGPTPVHTYAAPGSYTVTLVVTDANGCVSTLVIPNYVTVTTPPTASFTGSPTVACAPPVLVNFTNTSTGTAPLTYTWNFGDGGTSTAVNPGHVYASSGFYTVTLIVTDAAGCTDTVSFPNLININSVTAGFTFPALACAGNLVAFTDTSLGGVTTWNWDFGDGTTASVANPTHAYGAPGTYTVSLIASNGPCSDTVSRSVTVQPSPVANFGADSVSSCDVPFTVTFSDSSTGAVTWDWDFGDGGTSILPNPSHTYTAPGTFTVTLIVTNAAGCTDTLVMPSFIQIIPPVASIGALPFEGCFPLPVTFTDLSVSVEPIVSWAWDFGDGGTSTLQNPSHTYVAAGVYNISLIIINSAGCTDTANFTVTAGPQPTADFWATPLIACVGDSIIFSDSSNSALTWFWQFGDGGTSTLINPVHVFGDTGYFTVTLIVNNLGCRDTLVRDSFIYISGPLANFTLNPAMGCGIPHAVTFTDASGGADTWLWDFGDGFTSTLQNPVHTYTATGTYTVTLTVTDTITGCVDQANATVGISIPIADFIGAPTSGCAPLAVQFADNSTGATAWQWDFGDGGTSTVRNPLYTYTTPGTYTVTLIITDANGCSDTLTIPNYISVIGPTVAFSASADSGCVPFTVTFADGSSSSVPITSWLWDFGDGTTSVLANPTHTYVTAGLFTVTLTVTDANACSRTVSFPNYILATQPVALFSLGDTLACRGYPVSFNNLSTGVGLTYLWDFGDGVTSTAANPSHAYSTTGSYTVTLTVTDVNGCESTISVPAAVLIQDPLADFGAAPTAASCPPLFVAFSDSSLGGIVAWQWNFGDGTGSTLPNPGHIYATAGTFDVTLIVTSATGCQDTLIMPGLINISGPSGTFVFSPDSGCTPVTVTFIATALNSALYTWDFGDGSVVIGSDTVVHTYTSTGNFHPVLILDDGLGCTFSVISPDSVVVDTIPLVDFTSDIGVSCGPDSVHFTDLTVSTRPILSWHWDFGDGSIDSVQNPVHYYSSPGVYTVTLTVTNLLGCTDSLSIPAFITILNPPNAGFALSDTMGCAPFSVTFTDTSSTTSGTIVVWDWDLGDGTTSSLPSVTHTYGIPGGYLITLIVTDSAGCRDTVTHSITVLAPPVANFTVDDSMGCAPLAVNFTDLSINANAWQWSFGDGGSSTLQNPSHLYVTNGSYTVTLTVTDSMGCSDTLVKPAYINLDSPVAGFTIDQPVGCPPLIITFTDSSSSASGIVSWAWDFGDGTTGSGNPVSHAYGASGLYTVTLIVTDSRGCRDTVSMPGAVTLYDNLPPAVPPIYMVTVLDNTRDSLAWKMYTLPDFSHYVIYRETFSGSGVFLPIDSLYSATDTSYVNTGLLTTVQSYCYKLQVVDVCGLRSSLDSSRKHCTINLTTVPGINTALLSWNAYVGWDSVSQYDVYRVASYDTTFDVLIGTVSGTSLSYADTSVRCYQYYTYRVCAREDGGFHKWSRSDTAGCLPIHLPVNTPMRMVHATVDNDTSVLVEWLDASYLDPMQYLLEKSDDGVTWTLLSTFPPGMLSYLDPAVDVHNQSYWYQISLIDSCGDRNPVSNVGRSILLTAQVNNHLIQLNWNAYSLWYGGVLRYEIEVFNQAAGAWQLVDVVPGNITSYDDRKTNLNQITYCYRVRAIESGGLLSFSLSNEDCVPVGPTLFAPSAFTPNGDGLNDSFLLFGVYLAEFHVDIYDRWGELIFSSNDIYEGWPGTYKGADCPEGVFVYKAWGTGFDGTRVSKIGTVTLIR